MKLKIMLLMAILSLFFAGCSNLAVNNFPEDEYGSIIIIAHQHAKIHSGEYWFFTNQTTLGLGATRDILIKPTCPIDTHFLITIRSTGEANFFLYENTTVSNNGTLLQIRNRNRNYNDTNGVKLYRTPTVTTLGYSIEQVHFGNGQNTGGSIEGLNEIELNCNYNYLLRITSEAASNDIWYLLDWYD